MALRHPPNVLSPAVPLPGTWHFRLGWTAAWLDGEGSFHLRPKAGTACVQTSQKSRQALDWLQLMFGGSIYFSRRRTPDPRGVKTNPIWRWILTGPQAVGLMLTLYPLMTAKRQSEIHKTLLAWRQRPTQTKYRSRCVQGHVLVAGRRQRYCPICTKDRQKIADRRWYLKQRADGRTLPLVFLS
jgi:hypothetical protein